MNVVRMRPSRRKSAINLHRAGFEEVADFIAATIRRQKVGYAVHVDPNGGVFLTRHGRLSPIELPEAWKLGEYPYTGLRVEYIEEDLLDRQRALTAREAA